MLDSGRRWDVEFLLGIVRLASDSRQASENKKR